MTGKSMQHALSGARNAATALGLLSRSGVRVTDVSLCILCAFSASCAFKGRKGLCDMYRLDERDLAATEQRYLAAISVRQK